jgi:hypothetical protein
VVRATWRRMLVMSPSALSRGCIGKLIGNSLYIAK